jgi:hypothetical protein
VRFAYLLDAIRLKGYIASRQQKEYTDMSKPRRRRKIGSKKRKARRDRRKR